MSSKSRNEQIAAIAVARTGFFNPALTLQLYQQAGSAEAIVNNKDKAETLLPQPSSKLKEMLSRLPEAISQAQAEQDYNDRNGIKTIVYADDEYPCRLRQCPDAPIVLFYKGSARLNAPRTLAIVGTRHATTYGQELTRRFVADLATLSPGTLIISGLAYGIDIAAHNAALDSGMETIAVLAHGLDQLYPYRHKATADRMTGQGGLLSEYPTGTNADKMNFVRRNRIVAGMADACLLVESAAHGGGLITTRIAADYNRDVFAFPGAVGATYSEGCNRLIRSNGATLVTSAQDFVESMGWQSDAETQKARQRGIERQLFADLSSDEEAIVRLLSERGDLPSNVVSVATGIPIARLTGLLFALEMKGLLRSLAGGTYHLLKF